MGNSRFDRTQDFIAGRVADRLGYFTVFYKPKHEWCQMWDANGVFADTDRTMREYMVRTYSEAANDGR